MLCGHTSTFSNLIEHRSFPAKKRSKTEESKQIKKKKKKICRKQRYLYCTKSTKYKKHSLHEYLSWDLLQLWNRFFQSHRIQRLYRIQEIRERSLHKRSPLRSYWACLHRAQGSKQSHKIFVRNENSIVCHSSLCARVCVYIFLCVCNSLHSYTFRYHLSRSQ